MNCTAPDINRALDLLLSGQIEPAEYLERVDRANEKLRRENP